MTFKLEAAPNFGHLSTLFMRVNRDGKLRVSFSTTGAGKINLAALVRPSTTRRGKWTTFGKLTKKATGPKEFEVTISPTATARRLTRHSGYYEVKLTGTITDLYKETTSEESQRSLLFP